MDENEVEAWFLSSYENSVFSQNKVILERWFWKKLPFMSYTWAKIIAKFHKTGVILFESPDEETIRYIAQFNPTIVGYILKTKYPTISSIEEEYLQNLSPFWGDACEELGSRGMALKYPGLCDKVEFFKGVESFIVSGLDINKASILYKKTSSQFIRKSLWREFIFMSYGTRTNPSNPLLEEIPTFLSLIWGEETPQRSFEEFSYQEAIDAIFEIKHERRKCTI